MAALGAQQEQHRQHGACRSCIGSRECCLHNYCASSDEGSSSRRSSSSSSSSRSSSSSAHGRSQPGIVVLRHDRHQSPLPPAPASTMTPLRSPLALSLTRPLLPLLVLLATLAVMCVGDCAAASTGPQAHAHARRQPHLPRRASLLSASGGRRETLVLKKGIASAAVTATGITAAISSGSTTTSTLAAGKVAAAAAVAAPKAPKPCAASKFTVAVRTQADFARRTLYAANVTVTLVVYNDILLSSPLIFDRNFSCSIVKSATVTPVRLSYLGDDAPVLTVFNTNNVLFIGVSIIQAGGLTNQSRACLTFTPFQDARDDRGLLCPALLIVRAYGIQVTKAKVYGRIDVFRGIYVTLDSLDVTMPLYAYSTLQPWADFNTHGIIRVGGNGVPGKLLPSRVTISNCEIYEGWELITLYRGATGVTVRNNYLHDYYWTAVRCGADSGYVMDCYLNTISNNYILGNPSKFIIDSAAIYFCTHWYNPGNRISCNYIENGVHCFYFDFASTGITVEGGVCKATADTAKINNGKLNRFRSLIVVDNPGIHYNIAPVSCISVTSIHCVAGMGKYWAAMQKLYYNNDTIRNTFPYMNQICPPPTAINGVPCNSVGPGALNASMTGACSGVGYLNDVDLVTINSNTGTGTTCGNLIPNIMRFNRISYLNTTLTTGGFLNGPGGDFGLARKSPILAARPGFVSCPRRLVGPQPVLASSYLNGFGIAQPYWFTEMTLTAGNNQLNGTLYLEIMKGGSSAMPSA